MHASPSLGAKMTSRAAQYARQLAQAVREQLHGASYAVHTWRRTSPRCPEWCSTDRCALRLGYARGEHRSEPLVWRTPYGTLITTLVQTATGSGSIEIRADVRLAGQSGVARTQAQHLAVGVDLTIRAVLADIAQATIAAGSGGPAQLPGRNPDALDRWLAGIADEVTGRDHDRRPELPPGSPVA
jgi:hypothetical protein